MREITPVSELVADAEKIIKRLSPHQAFEMLKIKLEFCWIYVIFVNLTELERLKMPSTRRGECLNFR